jgi:hypothetical protein
LRLNELAHTFEVFHLGMHLVLDFIDHMLHDNQSPHKEG